EHPVGILRPCSPGFLAIDEVMVAVEFGAGFQRGKVGPRPRFGVALAPPVAYADDAGKQAPLLLGAAEFHEPRAYHGQAERQQAGRPRLEALDLEDQALDGVPARAAERYGPGGRAPAMVGQHAMPAHVVVAL